ncbi:MAG: VIT domain-containing protein, partial [Xanthomonadales bacterium]|nr:VIT domain-containing protein [Xanthomonadales bacterium]
MATSFEPLDPTILKRIDSTRHPQGRRVRDQLETDAWRRHPRLAQRLARRRQRRASRAPKGLRWQDRVLLVIAITLMALLLVRVESARADDGNWGLELATNDVRHTALALDTQIAVDVTGLSARVAVRQKFRNDGTDWTEGLYRFPLPDGAAVDRMTIQVGERLIEGEIHERAQAEQVYAKARAEGRTAAMVEQERVNQFQTRLANIGPGEEISVFIGFLLPVAYEDGTYRLRLPMTFTPRYDAPSWRALPVTAGLEKLPAVGLRTAFTTAHNPAFETGPTPVLTHADDAPGHRLAMDIRLRSGIEFASIESPYHVVDIVPERDGYAVRLADDRVRADRDFELAWELAWADTPQASLETWSDGEAVYAQLMLVPPIEEALTPRPREVMFIIDTSGSMQGASLEQAREALIEGLALLGPDDRFNVIRFASTTHALFSEPQAADGFGLRKAAQFIERLSADGGTVMGPALHLALTQPSRSGLSRQVVFITDGSVGNEAELLVDIADVLGKSRLFTVGIGAAPNAWFMRRAAEIGRGSFTQVGRADEVAERVGALWRRIRTPALRDLCVDWGVPAETYPEIIPDL